MPVLPTDVNAFAAQNFSIAIINWFMTRGVAIAFVFLIAYGARIATRAFLERIIRRLVPSKHFRTKAAERQREDTLIRIADNTIGIVIWTVAGLMILSEAGLDIGPLLAAAGVAGIAIGFGGQYLIRDVVAGLFIIIENQYRVGDVVCLNDTCGTVEDISIRKATLRDLDGAVHHVQHGVVTKVSNLSKEFARVNLNIGIAYSSNLEKVIEVVNVTGKALAEDPEWKDDIIAPIHFERVNDFGDSAIIIKILGDTEPLRQWAVAGEFRKRVKIAFDKAGIEMPFPQRVVHTAK
ncbi:MAG: mechanosensitive ion channel family protein [Patescibacteria group bacterium]|nr:mechanosensitive ion channel family protein [Patescibacteria group bacterium]